jgi:TIR domain
MPTTIFVSHSAKDTELVKELVEFLLAGLVVDPTSIRCTSLPGYRLPGGVRTSDQIREDLAAAKAVLGVITHRSAQSAWVHFELGASWALSKNPIVLLGHGVEAEVLMGPLKEINALTCETEQDLEGVLAAVASAVGCTVKPHQHYRTQLAELLAFHEADQREPEEDLAAVRAFFLKAPRKVYYVTPVTKATGVPHDRARRAMEHLAAIGELDELPDKYGPVYRWSGQGD